MAQKVRVYNLNTYPLDEIFKGDEVHIEPQDYWRDKKGAVKVMDIYEATDFKGQYHPVMSDGSGKMVNDPKFYKMLRLEPAEAEPVALEEVPAYKCMHGGCKHVSPSSEELEAHTRVKHPGSESLVLPEEDARIKAKQKSAAAKAG